MTCKEYHEKEHNDLLNSRFIDYYKTYYGPQMIKATIDDQNVLPELLKFYGMQHNWNLQLWTAEEIYGTECIGKHIYIEFQSENGRIHYIKGRLVKLDWFINTPMNTPIAELRGG
jgi:hypothetical protein